MRMLVPLGLPNPRGTYPAATNEGKMGVLIAGVLDDDNNDVDYRQPQPGTMSIPHVESSARCAQRLSDGLCVLGELLRPNRIVVPTTMSLFSAPPMSTSSRGTNSGQTPASRREPVAL
jgi:hypothetical protein